MSTIYFVEPGGALFGPVMLPVVPGIGVQIPENALELESVLAPCAPGMAWGLFDGEPVQLADHRGVVYATSTGEEVKWSKLGSLPADYTLEPVPGPHYVWQDGGWVLNFSAQKAAAAVEVLTERDSRMREAQIRIAPLQYAINLNMATEEEHAVLLVWMRYCVELNRIEQQSGYPLVIDWPALPGSALPQ
jgi:hypothetical protein